MNRRTLIARTAVVPLSLAGIGCLSSDTDADAGPADTWSDSPDIHEIQISESDFVTLDIAIRNHGTFNRPPVLTIRLRNDTDQSLQYWYFTDTPLPFIGHTLSHTETERKLQVLAESATGTAERCWGGEPDNTRHYPVRGPEAVVEGDAALVPVVEETATSTSRPDQQGCYRLGEYVGEVELTLLPEHVDPTAIDVTEHAIAVVELDVLVNLG